MFSYSEQGLGKVHAKYQGNTLKEDFFEHLWLWETEQRGSEMSSTALWHSVRWLKIVVMLWAFASILSSLWVKVQPHSLIMQSAFHLDGLLPRISPFFSWAVTEVGQNFFTSPTRPFWQKAWKAISHDWHSTGYFDFLQKGMAASCRCHLPVLQPRPSQVVFIDLPKFLAFYHKQHVPWCFDGYFLLKSEERNIKRFLVIDWEIVASLRLEGISKFFCWLQSKSLCNGWLTKKCWHSFGCLLQAKNGDKMLARLHWELEESALWVVCCMHLPE